MDAMSNAVDHAAVMLYSVCLSCEYSSALSPRCRLTQTVAAIRQRERQCVATCHVMLSLMAIHALLFVQTAGWKRTMRTNRKLI